MSTGIRELMLCVEEGELAPCDFTIYTKGVEVAVVAGGSAKLIDRFIREVAEYSEQPVDWHYVGGRARVLTTGDVERVRETIRALHLNCLLTRQPMPSPSATTATGEAMGQPKDTNF